MRTMSGRRGKRRKEFFVYTPGVAVPRDVTHALVHHSVKHLPREVFHGRRHLREIVLPEGLLQIGANAFWGCLSLEVASVPSSVTSICASAFRNCESLRELEFPEGLTELDEYAFYNCRLLELVSLSSTVTKIGSGTFQYCSLLRVVSLAEGIQTIGCCAFFNCRSLEGIVLPATVTVIGGGAFFECESLRMVELCGKIQFIGRRAFLRCTLDHVTTPSKALVVTGEVRGEDDDDDDEDDDDDDRELGGGEDDYRFDTDVGGREDSSRFRFVTDRTSMVDKTIPCTNLAQVVITSECFNSMSAEEISQLEHAITENMGLRSVWGEKHERLCELLAPYEVRHKKEVTTTLELALWKAEIDQSGGLVRATREECRLKCGTDVVIQNVLPFL